MVNRVASPSVRTPAAAPKTQAPKARVAQQAGQTAAAGWGADAKAPTSLKITSAKIDEGVATLPKIAVPKGYSVAVKDLSSKASDTVHGKKVGIEQTDQQVTLTGPNGKKMTVGSGGDMPGTLSEWKSEVKGAKAGPENEYLQLNWDSNHTTSGVGTAGKLFSVSDSYSSYTGGAHPNAGTALSTYDASTGKQVKLDSVLTQQQMTNLVNDISAKLGKMKGSQGVEGSSFNIGDKAALRETINSNFALTTDKTGKVKIEIAWESGIHALGPLSAHFTVDAPNDAAFRQKIGLETSAPPVAR